MSAEKNEKIETQGLSPEILAIIETPDLKVKDALKVINKLQWRLPLDDDRPNCPVEDSIDDAVKYVKALGLSASTLAGRKKETISMAIYEHARTCRHWAEPKEALEAVAKAIQEIGLPLGAPSRPIIDKPDLQYERRSEKYYHQSADGVWQGISYGAAARVLVASGMSDRRERNGGLSEVEAALVETLQHCPVDYAGPLAGYPAGVRNFGDHRILMTRGLKLIEPKQGEWEVIKKIVHGMFGETQKDYLYATLKYGYEAYRDDSDHPVPMITLCGPASGDEKQTCAWKSAFAKRVIIPFWGGRWADARRYIQNRTEFNADLFGAETLLLDDMKAHGNWMSRHDLSEHLKSIIVGAAQSLHAKHKDAIPLRPRWRVVLTINDDEEALRQMPDFAVSFKEKAHLFKVGEFELPMPNRTSEEWKALDAQIEAEMPAFITHYSIGRCRSASRATGSA